MQCRWRGGRRAGTHSRSLEWPGTSMRRKGFAGGSLCRSECSTVVFSLTLRDVTDCVASPLKSCTHQHTHDVDGRRQRPAAAAPCCGRQGMRAGHGTDFVEEHGFARIVDPQDDDGIPLVPLRTCERIADSGRAQAGQRVRRDRQPESRKRSIPGQSTGLFWSSAERSPTQRPGPAPR